MNETRWETITYTCHTFNDSDDDRHVKKYRIEV